MSSNESKVPTRRISRFGKIASLATRVTGAMMTEGAKQLAQGNRPKARDLLLTPQNMKRVADQLALLLPWKKRCTGCGLCRGACYIAAITVDRHNPTSGI